MFKCNFRRISTQLLIRFHSEFQRDLQYKFHQIADGLITNFNQISKNISLRSSISFYWHFFCIFIASLLDFSQIWIGFSLEEILFKYKRNPSRDPIQILWNTREILAKIWLRSKWNTDFSCISKVFSHILQNFTRNPPIYQRILLGFSYHF